MTQKKNRDLFKEIIEALKEIKAHRQGKLKLRSYHFCFPERPVSPLSVRKTVKKTVK